jgi:hypothetical protein
MIALDMVSIETQPQGSSDKRPAPFAIHALFSLPQSSKFFHSLSITSIFNRLHGVLNVGKKITNYTV